MSGYSGSGISGFSGFSGINGSGGTSGYSGFSGISGYSGASTSGYSGFSGTSGYSGASTSGYSGYSGLSGFSGYSGNNGSSIIGTNNNFTGINNFAQTVSIGSTASPGTLYVKGANSNNLLVDNGGQQYTTISLYNNGTEKGQWYWDQTNSIMVLGTDVNAPLELKTGTVARMQISGTGGVSIGTSTDPGQGNLLVSGSIISPSIIPSGSVLSWYQSAAPVGWTQVVTLNDYALRIVNDATGGTTGGSSAFSTVFQNQTPTTSGLSIGATTLDINMIPSHSHVPVLTGTATPVNTSGGTQITGSTATNGVTRNAAASTNNTGNSGSHNHAFSGSIGVVTLNVQYANFIIASKD
jgi:hypothetical protein